MIHRLIDLCLEHRWRAAAAAVLLALMGVNALFRLPVDAVPDITNVQILVNSRTGALAPEEIEKTVTRIVEAELAGIPRVEEIRSLSRYGLSQVIVIFEDGTDLYFSRQQIAERLNNLRESLPDGISPELGPVSTGLGEVLMYSVEAKPVSLQGMDEAQRLMYLRMIQDRVIRPALKTVSGVADVDSNGGYSRQVHINLNPYRMSAEGVSLDRLSEYVEGIGTNRGGNYVETNGRRILVRSLGRFESLDDIGRLPMSFGTLQGSIRLRDLARVEFGGAPRVGAATANGREAVLGTVFMRIGENSRVVAQRSAEKLQSLHLPEDVQVRVVYSRKFLVDETIQTVEKNLAEGAILVVAVMFVVIGRLRAALIASVAIPLSMLLAAQGMVLAGVSANLMSLGALDFGLLVDGSLVIVENCLRRMEEDSRLTMTFQERLELVGSAAKEVSRPVLSGMGIILLVYVPILALTGVEGRMFKPMALTVLFALAGSLVVCFTVVPVLVALFVKKKPHSGPGFVMRWFQRAYQPVLDFSLRRRMVLPASAAALFAGAMTLFPFLGSDFVPQLDEGDLAIGIVQDGNISLSESVRKQTQTEGILRQFPEVKEVFSRIGTPESATDPMGINFSDTFVILEKDRSKWRRGPHGARSKDELYEEFVAKVSESVPDQEYGPTQPIEMRFNEMLEGSRADVAIRVFGDDLTVLMESIERIEAIVKDIEGVSEAEMDELTAIRLGPVLDARLSLDLLAQRAVHPHEATEAFVTAMAGREVGSFYEKDVVFPIVLRLGDEFRRNPRAVEAVPIQLPGESIVSLGSVMRLSESEQAANIARLDGRRYASVAVFLGGRDVESFVSEARKKISAAVQLPPGYEIEWAGQYRNLQKARTALLVIVPGLVLVIFGILYQTFKSIRQSILILLCVPMALSGGILSLFARGLPFSISAAIGFIALSGIALLNGTVLVSVFNQLRLSMNAADAVRAGAMQRLRPVITTALVASLGFLPMALNSGLGSEVQRPLATVVIGGLLSATILTLGLLPALYLWLEGEDRGDRVLRAQRI